MAKLTVDQFAQKIKAQYPQYASLDNATLAEKMLQKYPVYQAQVESPTVSAATMGAPTDTGGGFLGTAGKVGGAVLGGIRAFGEGAGSTLLKTGLGVGGIASKAVGALSDAVGNKGGAQFYGTAVPAELDKIVPSLTRATPGAQERIGSLPGMAGGAAGTVATFAEGTPAVNAGKAALAPAGVKSAELLGKIPAVGKTLGSIAQRVLAALPEAGFGFGYGKTQGQNNAEAAGTGLAFGALSGVGEAAGDAYRAYKGTLADNVGRAIGMTGKMNATGAQARIPKAINALSIINSLAPDIRVVDRDGIEKAFNPSNATFPETLQAWTKARDQIYSAYTELATQAGDKGALFTPEDFSKVVDAIKSGTKDSTSAFKSKAGSLVHDIGENFGTYDTATGETKFENVPFDRVQSFLEKVNTDVNPLSDKAAAEVSATASKEIRRILDEKITKSTGGSYQKLRTAYGDMKSIENDLVNQYKKSARKSGTAVPSYIEGFGAIDLLVAALTGSPGHAVRGVGDIALGALMKNLRDPEKALRRAFQQMGPAKVAGPTVTRAFGAGKPGQGAPNVDDVIESMRTAGTKPGATKN